MEAVDRERIAELDRVVVEEVGLPLLSMMEHAGRHLAAVAASEGEGPYVVLAGKGNNGGGGLVAARHLANAGREVTVVAAYPAEEMSRAAATHRRVLEAMEVPFAEEVPDAGTVLDALLGYNARGPPRPPLAALVEEANALDAVRIALDLPTGLDATTGITPGVVVQADATVTLAILKKGSVDGRGPEVAGRLCLADIGIPAVAYDESGMERPAFGPEGRRWVEP